MSLSLRSLHSLYVYVLHPVLRLSIPSTWGDCKILSEPIIFQAALAGANTAARCLTVSHEGDAKLVLEVSASELGSVLRLLGLSGQTFTVTVSADG
jgi:hypothetical protein